MACWLVLHQMIYFLTMITRNHTLYMVTMINLVKQHKYKLPNNILPNTLCKNLYYALRFIFKFMYNDPIYSINEVMHHFVAQLPCLAQHHGYVAMECNYRIIHKRKSTRGNSSK